jgi:hypothetical protein
VNAEMETKFKNLKENFLSIYLLLLCSLLIILLFILCSVIYLKRNFLVANRKEFSMTVDKICAE